MIIDRTQNILAVESAIAGGSLSLIHEGAPVAGLSGRGGVSRAEDLLPNIDSLLRSCGIGRDQLDGIAVSVGPGSFTGLRIGLSTAIGLSAALQKPCIGVRLFDAVAFALNIQASYTVAAPIGKSDICFQRFQGTEPTRDPTVGTEIELIDNLRTDQVERLAVHPLVMARLEPMLTPAGVALYSLDESMAEYIGRFAAANPATGPLEPLYVQNPRFA